MVGLEDQILCKELEDEAGEKLEKTSFGTSTTCMRNDKGCQVLV